jgi:hypothetical protein
VKSTIWAQQFNKRLHIDLPPTKVSSHREIPLVVAAPRQQRQLLLLPLQLRHVGALPPVPRDAAGGARQAQVELGQRIGQRGRAGRGLLWLSEGVSAFGAYSACSLNLGLCNIIFCTALQLARCVTSRKAISCAHAKVCAAPVPWPILGTYGRHILQQAVTYRC